MLALFRVEVHCVISAFVARSVASLSEKGANAWEFAVSEPKPNRYISYTLKSLQLEVYAVNIAGEIAVPNESLHPELSSTTLRHTCRILVVFPAHPSKRNPVTHQHCCDFRFIHRLTSRSAPRRTKRPNLRSLYSLESYWRSVNAPQRCLALIMDGVSPLITLDCRVVTHTSSGQMVTPMEQLPTGNVSMRKTAHSDLEATLCLLAIATLTTIFVP